MVFMALKWEFLVFFFFFSLFFQNFQVGGLAIIHKRNEPNLATGQPEKQNFFEDRPERQSQ
jgi:hypothetical protein